MNSLTLGVFDGVHRGHQALLQGGITTVITFDPHPAHFFGRSIPLIMSLAAREKWLRYYGVDNVIVLPFTHEIASQTAAEFLAHFTFDKLVLGYDTAFGKNREGTQAYIEKLALEKGFAVSAVAPLSDDRGIISSSRIRELLARGQHAAARELLGHDF